MCAINDPLGHTHLPTSNDQYYHLIVVLFLWGFENWGRKDKTCENSDQYRPWLWVGLVDQSYFGWFSSQFKLGTIGAWGNGFVSFSFRPPSIKIWFPQGVSLHYWTTLVRLLTKILLHWFIKNIYYLIHLKTKLKIILVP